MEGSNERMFPSVAAEEQLTDRSWEGGQQIALACRDRPGIGTLPFIKTMHTSR